MDKGSTRPTSEDPGARETGSLLRTLEETSGGNTERVQTLRKKITLSSSDRRRRGEVVTARRLALDLGWLVTVERIKGEEEVLEEGFHPSHQATSGATGGGGELIAAREKENKKI